MTIGCGGAASSVSVGPTSAGDDGTSGSGGAMGGGGGAMGGGGGTTGGGGGTTGGGGGTTGGGGGTDGGMPGGGGGSNGGDGGTASACSTTPQPFARGLRTALLASDGSYVYGFAAQAIVRVGAAGGDAEPIVRGIDTSRDSGLVVDDAAIYWSWGDNTHHRTVILRAPKSGGDGVPIASFDSTGDARALVLNRTHVFFDMTYGETRTVGRVAKTGGTIATLPVPGATFAADDESLYSFGRVSPAGGSDATVQRTSIATGATVVLAQWLAGSWGGGFDAGATDDRSIYVADSGELHRVDKLAGGNIRIGAFAGRVRSLQVDGGRLYGLAARYEEFDGSYVDATLARIGTDGSGATTLAAHVPQADISAIAVTGDSVLYGSGAPLLRVCK